MYICNCNAVTEREIRQSVAAGARHLDDLARDLDVATCCGSCADDAQALLDDTLRATLDRLLQAA